MNRGKYGRMALPVALLAMLALVLQGCGGDDNNNVEQDLRDQITVLEGQLGDANTAKAAAEAAQAAAETAQMEAEAAQAEAETERDAANTAKGAAEAARMTAEAAQTEAEAAQTAAEEAQAAAETAQAAAEQAQTVAETERDAAAGSLAAAEMARDEAKDAEAAAKVAQAQAEAAQKAAEDATADAMADRDAKVAAAQKAQMDAETAQAAAEKAQTVAETAQAEAEQAQMDAEAAQAEAETERDAANAAKGAAEAAQMTAEAAQAEAEAAQTAAEEAQAAAETAQAAAEQEAEDAKAAQKTAEDNAKKYQDELAKLRGEVDTGETADANAAAKALLAVLANNNVAFTVPVGGSATQAVANEVHNKSGLSGVVTTATQDDGNTADVNEAAVERQRVANDVSNLMVEVSSDGVLTAEVEDNAAYKMSDTAPDMIEGWRGAMLTRGTTITDTVVVYSDIGNDGTETLLDRYTSTLPTSTEPRKWRVTTLNNAGDPIAIGGVPDPITWKSVERPDTKTSYAGTATVMLAFKGTVHDIPGTFSCSSGTNASGCRAPDRFSTGKVATSAAESADAATGGAFGDWNFVPDDGVSLYTDDDDYLTFGWWLQKDSGGNPADFLAFSTATGLGVMRAAADANIENISNGEFANDNATVHTSGATIIGSATYKGAAAGKYAVASATADSYEGGHFTANATLMVDFDADIDGDTTVRTTDGVSLSGVIDSFMTGSTARPDWSVKLMVDNDASDVNAVLPTATLVAPAGSAARMLTQWTTGAAAKGAGTWAAQWYGGVTFNAAGNAIATRGVPDAAVGTFNAAIGSAARLQGAFGVMKEE